MTAFWPVTRQRFV